jgi:hypothetical protein
LPYARFGFAARLQRLARRLLLTLQDCVLCKGAMINSRFLFRVRPVRGLTITFTFLALGALASAQQDPPRELVRTAMQNQINDDRQPRLSAWKERKYRGRQTQIATIVQTPDGTLSRVALIDNQPLTPEQRAAEEARLRRMSEPEQMRRREKARREDDERTRKMLSAIPDAFDFTIIDSTQAPNGHKLTRIRFTARPGFEPPTRESMVFTGMQGEILVDETAHRLAKIDGTLFREVNFGWGILGKLYPGGRFFVEQTEVTPSHWETTRMMLHFDGKALLFKSIHIDENETSWDYHPVPPMSVAQAMDFLTRSSQSPQDALLAP